MSKILYGNVKKVDVQYEWKSESGACEVCQELDGTVYDTASNIPDRPHPNCKCWIEVLEREKETTDPIELRREQAKDKKRMQQELAKLLGDAKSLEEEIDEYMKQIEEQEEELNRIERAIDTDKLETADRRRLTDAKEQIDFAKNKADKAKQEISEVKKQIGDIESSGGTASAMDKLYYCIKSTQKKIYNMALIISTSIELIAKIKKLQLNSNYLKDLTLAGGYWYSLFFNMPNAYELFKLSARENNYNEEFVKKNGKLYQSIDNLNNAELINNIHSRIKEEIPKWKKSKNDCKVLVLNNDSSVSKAIEHSHELSQFISKNFQRIKKGERIRNTKIEFSSLDSDLYATLHGAIIREAYLDSEENLVMVIEDYYNFNPNRTSLKGQLGERLQNMGELENYYIIMNLKMPKNEWKKLKI